MNDAALRSALDLHRIAAGAFVTRASNVSDIAWNEPLAEGKWSAGEVVDHLLSAYDVLLGELRGGPGMQVRTTPWQRLVLRIFYVPRILRTGWFPKGARAPRETRPTGRGLGREESLLQFTRRASELEEAARLAPVSQRLTHAYFGTSSVETGIRLCARHIQHHAAQLPHAAR